MLETELIKAKDPNSRRLMVMLHGLGDSSQGYYWMPEALSLPWLNYLLVNAPDPYYGGYSWFDFAGNMVPGVARSRALLYKLLDEVRADGLPSESILLGGFSQGCLMSIEVGLRYPHRLAGILGISGYVCEPEKALKELSPVAFEQRFLVTHGTMDPLIPFQSARQQFQMLKSAGLNVQWHEFIKAHTIAGEAELAVIRNFICDCYAGSKGHHSQSAS